MQEQNGMANWVGNAFWSQTLWKQKSCDIVSSPTNKSGNHSKQSLTYSANLKFKEEEKHQIWDFKLWRKGGDNCCQIVGSKLQFVAADHICNYQHNCLFLHLKIIQSKDSKSWKEHCLCCFWHFHVMGDRKESLRADAVFQ